MHFRPQARRGTPLVILALLGLVSPGSAADLPRIETKGLPPRTIPEAVPERPIPAWLRSNVRIGHLPPGLGRMPESFVEAGYNVLIINALRKWDIVGPSAALYDPAEVKLADEYMRKFVSMVHATGAKALFYIGPVQVPAFSPEFVKAHPDWLRVNADGKVDASPNFVNVRSAYTDWPQAARLSDARVQGRRLLVRRLSPGHLHTYDPATRGVPEVLRRQGNPGASSAGVLAVRYRA